MHLSFVELQTRKYLGRCVTFFAEKLTAQEEKFSACASFFEAKNICNKLK